MKLPTSLVLLATLGLVSTSGRAENGPKRELLEGNYGDPKRQIRAKDVSPGVVYAKDYTENMPELPPGHDVFGARHQPISKISDLLAGAGAPFEVAVANHLSSPISIYQRLASSPYQVSNQQPFQESQATYSNARSNDKPQNQPQQSQNPQTVPDSAENEVPQTQFHKLNFITIGRPNFNSDLGRPRGFSVQTFQTPEPRQIIRMLVKPEYSEQTNQQFFPIEPQGPFRRPGHFIPAQYLQQQSIYQLIPMQQSVIYQTQGKPEVSVQDQQQQVKFEANERRQVQKPEFLPQQSYHAHPNGAISFASFTQNLASLQPNSVAPQPIQRPINFFPLQKLQSSTQEEVQLQPQEFQQLQNHQTNLNYVQNPHNYQPQFQSNYFQQYIPQNEQQPPSELLSSQQSAISVQPRQFNPLQHQLLLSNVGYSPLLQSLHHIPAFKPLSNSIHNTNKPLSTYRRLPENPLNLNPQTSKDSDQSHQTSSVSERSTHTKSQPLTSVPVFVPTTLQPTTNTQTSDDQTTRRPETVEKSHDKSKAPQTQSLLDDEDQLLTVQPLIRHKTESDSKTPEQSTPQSVHAAPRHLVTIQKQELREITSEPAFQPLKYARILHPQFLIQQHNVLNEKQSHKENVHPTLHTQLSSSPQRQNIQKQTQGNSDNQQIIHEKENEQNSKHIKETDSENSQTEQLTTSQPETSSEKPQSHSQNIQTNVRPTLIYRLEPENHEIQEENQLQHDPFQPTPTSDESLESLPLGTLQLFPQSQEESQQEYSSQASADFPSVQYFGKYAQSLFGEYPR